MSKLAVDVVIIPPDETMDLTVWLNHLMVKHTENEIVLDKNTCLPHITVAMGVIDDSDIYKIGKLIAGVAQKHLPIDLTILGTELAEKPDGGVISSLTIQNSKELQALHNEVMDTIVPHFTYDNVSADMFFSPPAVNHITNYWVKNYVRTNVRENYKPHMTLGLGALEPIEVPITFTATKLALCHLGNYCTCRKILYQVSKLGER